VPLELVSTERAGNGLDFEEVAERCGDLGIGNGLGADDLVGKAEQLEFRFGSRGEDRLDETEVDTLKDSEHGRGHAVLARAIG
jgi:hypothetical protein